jgi:colanic acid biosynthesis glycosyl transferase WcaI
MRLLLLAPNFWPEPIGIGFYTGDLADWLHARGHQISVVTNAPYYPNWSVARSEHVRFWRHDRRKPYPVLRCPQYVPRRPSVRSRLAHVASLGASFLPAVVGEAMRHRPGVVGTVMPTIAAAPAALIAAAMCGARTWLHVQDLEVDAALGLGMTGRRRVRDRALGIERRILRRFDLVSTISPEMRTRLREKVGGEKVGADREIEIYPNWLDRSKIYPMNGLSSYRAAEGIPAGATVALYSGSLVAKQGLEAIVDAARLLAHRADIIFVICGDGPLKGPLMASASGLAQVRFLPLQPRERLNELLNLADIHLLAQTATMAELVMPSKLGPMLATGRPVIAAVNPVGSVAQAIGSAGLIVPPGDPQAFADAILELASTPDRRQTMGEAGRIATACLDRDAVLSRIETALLALAGRA